MKIDTQEPRPHGEIRRGFFVGGNMAGRKRKVGLRHPCGQLNKTEAKALARVDREETARTMPHRRGVPDNDAIDPKAESLLGRFRLNGWVSQPQFEAGQRYASIVFAYRATIEAPECAKPSMGGSLGRAVIDDKECELRKKRYDDAYCELFKAGQRACRAVSDVAVHDRQPWVPGKYLCDGLTALGIHFGLLRPTLVAFRRNAA